MQAIVVSHHDDGSRRVFDGDEAEVRKAFLHAFPWVATRVGGEASLEDLVQALDSTQAYTAVVKNGDLNLVDMQKSDPRNGHVIAAMLGFDARLEVFLEAARFLADSDTEADPVKVREALWAQGEDPRKAALASYGLPVTPDMLLSLDAVIAAAGKLRKSESPEAAQIVAATESGHSTAEAIRKAFDKKLVSAVKLGGKHSKGALLAQDPDTHQRYLLKPGSGPQNPAAGESEDVASQSKREAAFYAVAKAWGLEDYIPEAHLLLIDGREYAAMKLLGSDFKDLNEVRHQDPVLPRRLFHIYLDNGYLHKWATLDYVLGNADSNAGNVMVRGEEVKLIDHGSAFAGDNFLPAVDRYTYVPYYLRAMARDDFESLSPEDAFRALPRVHGQEEPKLEKWISQLDAGVLKTELGRYGIDPEPEVRRLQKLKQDCLSMPADAAVNAAWTLL